MLSLISSIVINTVADTCKHSDVETLWSDISIFFHVFLFAVSLVCLFVCLFLPLVLVTLCFRLLSSLLFFVFPVLLRNDSFIFCFLFVYVFVCS